MEDKSFNIILYEKSHDDVQKMCGELDINVPDSFGEYLITAACSRLQTDNVRFFISKGANPNVKNAEGNTPLLCVIDVANHNEKVAVEIIKMLIDAGANLEARGYMDKTPFLKACSRGCLDVLKVLVAHGCDINTVAHDLGGDVSGLEFANIFETSTDFKAYLRSLYRSV